MRFRDFIEIAIAAFLHELENLLRRRTELILIPIVSMTIAMVITPVGLTAYGGSIDLHRVVIPSFIMLSVISGSVASAAYFVVELSLESIDRLLQVPWPRTLLFCLKAISASIAGVIAATAILLISTFYIGISTAVVASTVTSAFIASLGVIGATLTISYPVKNIQRLSLAVSLASSVLTYLSPLYYPLDVLPLILRTLIMFNPPTLAIELLREAVLKAKIDIEVLTLLILINVAWLSTGIMLFISKISKR